MQVSIEFFPPHTDQGRQSLLTTAQRLQVLQPEYFSVTYGAGGSTKDNTFNTVESLLQLGVQAVPHLSFGFDSEQSVATLLDRYKDLGASSLVALRGDTPSGVGSGKRYAEELVRFVRNRYGNDFYIQIAAYPEVHPDSATPKDDLYWFKRKVDAGADAAITQYFYNCDAYEDFLNRCAQAAINIPIVPGVMPINNCNQLVSFSQRCGAEIPRWILKRLEQYQDDSASLQSFGVDVVTAMCERLKSIQAPGLHFYTMNKAKAVLAICNNIAILK